MCHYDTAAAADGYAAAPPWRVIGAERSAGWTLLEIAAGGGEGVHGVKRIGGGEVTAGGASRATSAAAAPAAPLSRVVLSTGLGADGKPLPSHVAGAAALWDEVKVAAVDPALGLVTAAKMSDDVPVAGGSPTGRSWVKLPAPADPALAPGARVSASAVTMNGAVYLFGGERGGLPLDDLWELSLVSRDSGVGSGSGGASGVSAMWRRVTFKGAAPAGRYEHAAAVVIDVVSRSRAAAGGGGDGGGGGGGDVHHRRDRSRMVVHGGRGAGGAAVTDMWAYEFSSASWTKLAENTPAGARFGHAAASPPGVVPAGGGLPRVYMFGGVAEAFGPGAAGSPAAPTGFATSSLFECDAASGSCQDISFGCTSATPAMYTTSGSNVTYPRPKSGSGSFTPPTLGPRYGHALVATDTHVFVHGGTAAAPTGSSGSVSGSGSGTGVAAGAAGLAGSDDGVFAFSPAACAWREAGPVNNSPCPVHDFKPAPPELVCFKA